MSDKKLTDDDIKIWKKVIGKIEKKALSTFNMQVQSKSKSNQRKIKPTRINKTSRTRDAVLEKSKSEKGSSKNSKIDKRVLSKIKSGKLAPEETLDLHGHTMVSAKKLLSKFLVQLIFFY